MKVMTLVCQRCKHEQTIKIYDREDAERLGIRLEPPRCGKCGSPDIRLYD